MTVVQEIEQLRKTHNLNIVDVCNALCLSSEQEYWNIVHGRVHLTIFQQISFIDFFKTPLNSIQC